MSENFKPQEYNQFKDELNCLNQSMKMMRRRLGDLVWEPRNFQHLRHQPDIDPEICGLKNDSVRLAANGGFFQQDRMIFDKKRSLDRAILYSYQGAEIKKITNIDDDDYFEGQKPRPIRALINPDKNKQDYDDKILSVHYEYGIQPGDVFEWLGTKTHWLVYLQDLTEIAYFRGEIRRCQYEIQWDDDDGRHKTYAAIRGPVETKINFIQKHQISVDEPNHSLSILMPRNEATLKYFKRYSKFYLQGTDEGSPLVCWRVQATDWISTPGILEVIAVEYYYNSSEDDLEEGIVGGLIVGPDNPNDELGNKEELIEGEIFIKPKRTYTYTFLGQYSPNIPWEVCDNVPVKVEANGNQISLQWTSNYSGQFELKYGDIRKVIVVESLF